MVALEAKEKLNNKTTKQNRKKLLGDYKYSGDDDDDVDDCGASDADEEDVC